MFLSFCVAYAWAEPKSETQAKDSTSDISQNTNNSQEKRIEYLIALAQQLEEQNM